jgi:tetratricopeptide (TPR) repeat protein
MSESASDVPPTLEEIERQRTPAERLLTRILHFWWVLAVLAWGGALSSQFGSIFVDLVNRLAQGQPIDGGIFSNSVAASLFAKDPLRGMGILGVALVITFAAWLAERAEKDRLERLTAAAAAKARAQQRNEAREDTRRLLEEFFSQQATQARSEELAEEEASEAAVPIGRALALPPRPALVVGRDHEITRTIAALQAPGTLAVELHGMGGVGKSTLLLETLYRLVDAPVFKDGIIWLSCRDLAQDSGEVEILDGVGLALGIDTIARAQSATAKGALLRRALAGRKMIVALDNVEGTLPLDRIVPNLVPRTAAGVGPVVLFSTRVSMPDVQGLVTIDLDTLNIEAGLDLLKRLLARSGKTLDPEDEAAARSIVQIVGALPLAIDLIAPRIARSHEPLAALVARLSDGTMEIKGRTRSIDQTFDDTFSQLPGDQQLAYAALAVFAGDTFGQEAALSVIAAVNGSAASPQILLDFVDLSLLREAQGDDGSLRFSLHPLLRQYARERLRASGEDVVLAAELAAAQYYRGLVKRRGGRRPDFKTIEREYGNILGALTWAHGRMSQTTGDDKKDAVQIVADICSDTQRFMLDRGYWSDARRVLPWGVEAEALLGNYRRQNTLLAGLGFITRLQGDLDQAERYFKIALDLARAHNERFAEAARLQNLGTVALSRGETDRARALYEEALSLRRSLGDEGGMSASLRALGILAAEQSQWDVARAYLREAIELKKAPAYSRARTYTELASVLLREPDGDREQAHKLLDAALEAARAYHLVFDEAHALDWLGALALAEGDLAGAAHDWESALEIYSRLGASYAQPTRERLARIRQDQAATAAKA